jgi:hypothetical protein
MAGRAKFRGHCKSILARQHYIEHEGIVVLLLIDQQSQGCFTVAHRVYGVTLSLKIESQSIGQVLLVLYY